MVSLQNVSRRQHHRFERPQLAVRLNGVAGQSRDWSLGGIAVQLAHEAIALLSETEEISGELDTGPDGPRLDFQGRIVRVEGEGDVVAIEFSRLSEGAVMTFVNHFRMMMAGAT